MNFRFYTGRFGGTSAACPQIAGIAALVLSLNPGLTQQQVFDIITGSANKVGGYSYPNGRSNELGFGRANARDALLRTPASLTITGPDQVCGSSVTYEVNMANATWAAEPASLFTTSTGSGRYFTTSMSSSASSPNRGTIKATTVDGCGRSVTKSVQIGRGVPTGVYNYAGYYQYSLNTYQYVAPGRIEIRLNQAGPFTWTSDNSAVTFTQTGTNTATFNIAKGLGVRIGASTSGTGCEGYSGGWVFLTNSPYRLSFAPNPATSELTVTAVDSAQVTNEAIPAAPPFEAELYDNFGKKVKAQKSAQGKAVLDLRDLPNGLYNLRAGKGKEAISEHIQVTH